MMFKLFITLLGFFSFTMIGVGKVEKEGPKKGVRK